jgi:MFS family permease
MNPQYALEGLNFFMADVQAGIGPFLGVFLQAQGWHPEAIGTVMTLGGIAGMLATSPAGALVDATHHKRGIIVIAGVMTTLASLVLWLSHSYWIVAASQICTAVTGAALGPAVAGVTLGIVREKGFDRQFGRNQVANHAGNVVGAALSGWLGWRYGFGAVFVLAGVFGILTVIATLLIRRDAIDHDSARGLAGSASNEHEHASGFRVLLTCRPLLLLAAALAMFHLGNAAMLPLYGLAVVAEHQGDPSAFTAQTIVVAQLVMVAAAYFANRLIQRIGYWGVMLITFLALPLRGVVAAMFIGAWGVWPVQALDGIGAGLQSVAVPALVVRLLRGTGRVNVGQGVVMTVQGLGAALSPALGGVLSTSATRAPFWYWAPYRWDRSRCGSSSAKRSRKRAAFAVTSPTNLVSPYESDLSLLGHCIRRHCRRDLAAISLARSDLGGGGRRHARRARADSCAACVAGGRQGHRRLSVSHRHDAAFGTRPSRGPFRLGRGACRELCPRIASEALPAGLSRGCRGDDVPVERRGRRRAHACRVCRRDESAHEAASDALRVRLHCQCSELRPADLEPGEPRALCEPHAGAWSLGRALRFALGDVYRRHVFHVALDAA